ncbi:MAG: helix-turn-helix domain-containing protein [Anaerolineaceae bacterium]|nr:helix-turn-helix domain-containing protein [Anaerolineaceae bacterium]
MDIYGKEAISIDVGQRLRALREERDVSMRALARRSGLSANALSMIERGLTSPSVSTLSKLASALEVPITAFFRQEPEKQKVVFRKAAERARLPFLRGLWEGLGGESYIGRMEAFMLTLERGASSGPHGMLHTGHEFIFCLRGNIDFEVDDQHYLMQQGDSLLFTAQLVHRWRNPGQTVANLIIVISGFEESERPVEFHLASTHAVDSVDDGSQSNEPPEILKEV